MCNLNPTLCNIISPNNLLLNLYFENLTVELYVLKMYANFHANRSINSYFMYYFKLQKLQFKQLIDDMTIDL